MRILLANSALHVVGGSETYLLTVAEQLVRLGHDVRIFARTAGDVAELARRQAIPVVTDEADLGEPADVVVSQDGAVAYALAAAWPHVPQVFVCHSSLFDFQQPPLVPGFVSAVVVLNDRVRRRVAALNADLRIVRLTQPIDTQRFQPQSAPAPRPRSALILSNYLAADARQVLVDTWQEAGVHVVQIGTPGRSTVAPEEGIAAADIVVAKGRAALEAMACGRPTYLYDVFGSEGWITPDNYAAIEADGITGNQGDPGTGSARLRADLEQYDPELGRLGRELICSHHDARHHAHALLDLMSEVVPIARPGPTLESELGRQVSLRWAAEGELFAMRAGVQQISLELTQASSLALHHERRHDQLAQELELSRQHADNLTRELELSRQDAESLRRLTAVREVHVGNLRDRTQLQRRRIRLLRSELKASRAKQQGRRGWSRRSRAQVTK